MNSPLGFFLKKGRGLRALIRHRRRVSHVERLLSKKHTVHLCSFPKSGRTWLRFILSHYLTGLYDLDEPVDFITSWHVTPQYSPVPDAVRGPEAYRYAHDTRFPSFMATHSPYQSLLFRTGRIILLVRSPYDVLVSHYYHVLAKKDRPYEGDMSSLVRHPKWGIAAWISYHNLWAPVSLGSSVLVISYRALSEQPENTLGQVLAFSGVPQDESVMREALERSSFDAMKRLNVQQRPDVKAELRRTRKGKVGAFREELTLADIDYIRSACERDLSEPAKELLQKHEIEVSVRSANGGW